MPAFFMNIPAQGFVEAYAAISAGTELGKPLITTVKRIKYGLPAPTSLQDFLDEQILFDTTNMAAAVVNLHPELLSVVPSSAALIQTNFITQRSIFGISTYLDNAGPAQPQQTASVSNTSGWATLVPYTDDNGQPLVSTKGANKGLILYDPQWSPALKTLAGPATANALKGAKNYVSSSQGGGTTINLGVDATPGRSNIPDSELLGTIWTRTDGQTSINQSPGTPASQLSASNVQYVLTNDTMGYKGYSANLPAGDSTTIALSFSNSYLRYLGVFAQFYDSNNAVVPVSKLPSSLGLEGLNTKDAIYLGFIPPEFTLYGIPILTSTLNIKFPFPTDHASSAAIVASGLGTGSHTFQETETLGLVMTSLFNYVIPTLMMGLGIAQEFDILIKTIVIPFFTVNINVLVNLILDMQSVAQSPAMLGAFFWKAFVKAEAGPGLGLFVTKILIPFLTSAEVIDSAEDAIPIAGLILQAISVLGVSAELAETTVEVLSSPWTYQYSLVGTHDLNVTILPDPKHTMFPSGAASCTLTAIFDGGTPHVNQFAIGSSPGPSISATFRAVPLGGQVTLNVAIYTTDGTQVGHGTVGPVKNDDKANPSITTTEDLLPITQGTTYFHKQKTALDAQGNHQWICAPAPAEIAPVGSCENHLGDICALRKITANAVGNIGYAWQSYSTASCSAGGSGQLDQLANLSAVNGTNGNAEGDYAFIPCALTPGTQLIYDPSSGANSNFYLDTSSNVLRQIQLSPPSFDDPRNAQAWGRFNLSSTDLLLHPAGTIVSINASSHKLESLKIPASPKSDAEAAVMLLANVYCGFGSRPGLLDTPTVTTITAEGVVLVLEAGNNRIHAMDIYGNPVRLFSNQPSPYFLNFSQTGGPNTQYLDIAAEFSGFIYVLSSSTTNQGSYQYRLDIYASDQTGTNPISTTMGFNAAKLAVDYWRNVFSLNYEVLRLPDQSFPSSGVTEPSVSQWIPTTPPACLSEPPVRRQARMKRTVESITPRRLLRRRDFWRV